MAAEAVTIFLSAFLLFSVEPMIGKAILPWFGGAPAVWTTCLLFFQTVLLGGYFYADRLSRRPAIRSQRAIHIGLLAISLVALGAAGLSGKAPILPGPAFRPPDPSAPVARVLAALGASIGLPFFLLSTTGPLLQAWIARRSPRYPIYRLYALSNAASLAALLAYPFAIEPALPLTAQATIWSAGYVLFAAGAAFCATRAARPAPDEERPPESETAVPPAEGPPPPESLPTLGEVAAGEPRSGRGRALFWFALAACGSGMLLAATNQMCQEVAAIPFLWVLPLSLYLVSFILCFQSDRLAPRFVTGPLLAAALGWAAVTLARGYGVPIRVQVSAYSLAVFAVCMACHGELARSRPAPGEATRFYLAVAAGGAAGAAFVAVAAPLLFTAFWEFHLLLGLSALAVLVALVRDRNSWLHRGSPWPALAVLLGMTVVVRLARDPNALDALFARGRESLSSLRSALVVGAAAVAAAILVWTFRRALAFRGHPWFVGACLAGAVGLLGFALAVDVRSYLRGAVALSRSFYGVLTIEALDVPDPLFSRLSLRHGRIIHGFQYQPPGKRRIPTTYYGEGTGIALILENHPRRAAGPLRVGVVGLGVGTLAAYGRAGDVYRFYDINPDVVRLSTGPEPRFTYLADSPAKIEIALGDARLSLERELAGAGGQDFDVLAVDAFSSDAIPVHLLTREAIALYFAHLRRPDGVLALHISNRQLDLLPVAKAAAEALGVESAVVDTSDRGEAVWGATWVLLARGGAALEAKAIEEASNDFPESPRVRLWTDDYSNLFDVLK